MNKRIKQVFLLIVMLCTLSSNLLYTETAFAKTYNVKTVKSSKKNIQIKVGKTATIKLKNPKGKVKWKIANKKVVRIVKKSGKYKNKIVIKGRKAGKTKITVKCGRKKYNIKVVVKKNKVINSNNKVNTTFDNETVIRMEETTAVYEEVTTLQTEEIVSEYVEETTTSNEEESTLGNVEETTTYEEETTTILVEEPTTNPSEDETEGERVVGRVVNNIAVNGMLVIEYSAFDYEARKIISYNSAPENLERLVEGQWVKMEYKDDIELSNIRSAGLASSKLPLIFTPSQYYKDIVEGHYRYTHEFEDKGVSVEFDIVSSTSNADSDLQKVVGNEPTLIVAEITNNTLLMGESIVIKSIITGKGDWDFTNITEIPGKLEIYEDDVWNQMEINSDNVDWSDVDKMIMGSCFYETNIKLDEMYLNIRKGHYRYTYVIGGYELTFEFDIVES